ncbi:hypothetical protein L0152_04360, partial [bacterium]|nr:hypothetical protein [bacterium]
MKSFFLQFVFWTFVALCVATQSYLDYHYYGMQLSFFTSFCWEIIGWLLWGVFTPLIFLLARRYPPQKYFFIHIPAAFVVSAIHLAIQLNLFRISEKIFLPPGDP